jgi:HEAT repeat protein
MYHRMGLAIGVAVAVGLSSSWADEPVNDGKKLSEWVKQLKSRDAKERARAAEAIGEMKEDAKGSVGQLLPLLKDKDDDVRVKTAGALGRIGQAVKDEFKPAVPHLIELLKKDGNEEVRTEAADSLGRGAVEAKTAVPALIDALKKDSGMWVRKQAARSLQEFPAEAKTVVPALVAALKDKEEDVRKSAGESLREIDPDAAKKAGVR